MWAAPCSWRVRINWISFCWQRTSKIFKTTPPGRPNTVLTPSCLKDSQKISAPVFFIVCPYLRVAARPLVLLKYFHHSVFADEFELLNPLHLDFFFRGQMMLVLIYGKFFFEILMFFVIFFQFRVFIQ